MNAPRRPQISAGLAPVTTDVMLTSDTSYDQSAFTSITLLGNNQRGVSFDECSFTDTELSSQTIRQLTFMDVRLERSRLFGLKIDGSLWRRVEMSGTHALGLVATDATFEDVIITDCKLDQTNFRLSKFRRVVFRRCSLRETDFSGAVMSSVRFDDCELEATGFDRATLQDVSLVGSRLGILHGLGGLRGATISSTQLMELAPQLAHEAGLKVEDNEAFISGSTF